MEQSDKQTQQPDQELVEAVLPAAEPQQEPSTAASEPSQPPESDGTLAPERRGGLLWLLLLLVLASLGLHAWQWYQQQKPDLRTERIQTELQALDDGLSTRLDALQQQVRALPDSQVLERAQSLVADLQRSQQALAQRFDSLQGEGQREWKLDEATYLLRLASLRLLAGEDVTAATGLLEAADRILREQPDSGIFAVREELARQLTELRTLPDVDRPGLYLQLSALREQAGRLQAPAPVYQVEQSDVPPVAAESRWQRVLQRLDGYVRVDFQRGRDIRPQMDRSELQRVRHSLQLQLEQAQWAVLRSEQAVWEQSFEQAEGVLAQFFEEDDRQVSVLRARFAELRGVNLQRQLPDLSVLQQSLDAYVQSRRSAPVQRED